jgi:hypothetical protein
MIGHGPGNWSLDIKKPGRIPEGGGRRAHGRSEQVKGRGIDFDYVHVAIDDHTRIGYAEVLPDEKGATAAWFLAGPQATSPATASTGSNASSPTTLSPTATPPRFGKP